MKKFKAFTLVEILLTIGLISFVVAISVPVYGSYQVSNRLESASKIIKRAGRTAQINAQEGQLDSAWGLRVENERVIIFAGDTYATRDQAADIFLSFSSNLTGHQEFVYQKLSGDLDSSKQINLMLSSKVIVININEKGVYI